MAVLRHSSRDGLLVTLAAGYGALLIAAPSALLVAVGVWWIANTVAHNFIHRPFFRSRRVNVFFSGYLSLLLGVPQTLWRARHLAHHAGRPWRLRWTAPLLLETTIVLAAWLAVALTDPRFFVWTWLVGWSGAMVLCTLQGHYEHVDGTVSHYGRWYNFAFFNDGFHAEHHAHPGMHWSELPRAAAPQLRGSRWPAVLRWLELVPLDALERVVLRSRVLQQFVVDRHTQAFQQLISRLPPLHRVTIVGGGLFPRSALVLRHLIPSAEITILDRSAANLRRARAHLDSTIRIIEASYAPAGCAGADLVVLPLAFDGDRNSLYAHPPAPAVAVHDWIWHRRGEGYVISYLLLKRLNLVRR